jgi:co-chaperonin GroES (HSP10)
MAKKKDLLSSVEPIADRIFVKLEQDIENPTTPGGIVLPDSAKPHQRAGIVVAVGPGALRVLSDGTNERHPMQCEVGDRVILPLPPVAEGLLLDENDPDSKVVVCQDQQIICILH